jgi:hypothetical protein
VNGGRSDAAITQGQVSLRLRCYHRRRNGGDHRIRRTRRLCFDSVGSDSVGSGKPGSGKPGSGKPGSDKPGSDKPGSDKPGSDNPGSDNPGSDNIHLDMAEKRQALG